MTKILIIEDNSVLLDSISDFLAEEGFTILKALNGEEGVTMALEHIPDIILSDIYMPKLDGYGVFDALRKNPSTSMIPFIFISAKAEKEDILFGLKMGADDYIIKPIDFPELLKRILTRIEKNNNQIQLSEIKYKALFESATDAILMVRDNDGRIVDVNPSACTILGKEKDQLVTMSVLDLLSRADGQSPLPFYSPEQGWGDYFLAEAKWIPADNKVHTIEVSGRRIHLIGENYVFLIVRDITMQKEFQQQLIQAKEKAEESDRLKSSILANMSHELRTPLNGILGFSDILREELKSTELVTMAENIKDSGIWLLRTLDSILTLSQLESGKVNPNPVETDMAPVILEVVNTFQAQARDKEIYIKANVPEALMCVSDHRLIRQIVMHLVDNAIKFTQTGGITVEASFSTSDPSNLNILVSDTGIGIPAESAEMIFQGFRQVSEGMGRKFQGSGLGLTIVRKTIDLLNGTISLESEPGKGSIFRVMIPGVQAPHPETDPREEKEEPQEIMPTTDLPLVLLVEDNLLNRELTAHYLRDECTLDHTTRGEEAVVMAREKRYDAILMDINLGPGIDGMITTRSIRDIPGYQHIPIIALTGYSYKEEISKIMSFGCSHYITKPYDKPSLVNLLRQSLCLK
ncbi:MAG TPA: response regulator [Bacteroidales bacterium]|nr:response regulator [Bacteroidales bacterium]HPS74249.1 response regulator [Bacteroidales bacterium]